MQIAGPVAYFVYVCCISKLRVLCKNSWTDVFIWYFGTLHAVIYSLNLDLANKCVPLKTALLWSVGAIFYKKTIDKSIVFLYLEFMILL